MVRLILLLTACCGRKQLAFVDSYLAALAAQRQCPVYTKNVREFVEQGVVVPQTLPSFGHSAGL